MTTKPIRPWVAKIRYPGKEPVLFGTVTMPLGARHDEIESALRDDAEKCLPSGFIIEAVYCGAIFFQEYVE